MQKWRGAGNFQDNGSNSMEAVMHRVTLCLWKAFGRKAIGSRGVRESDLCKDKARSFSSLGTQTVSLILLQ